GPATASRHKKVLKKAKGYYGARRKQFRTAVQAVEKAGQYAYRDRRAKKRNFRSLWIQRINAGAREHGMTYSVFMNGLTKAGIEVDRKVLSDIAIREPEAFKALVDQARAALG
ncbi:50S ribosomal protein L20, partial [Maricaulis sp.]|uniref:50S ribosomal protein L20 n=1 Tax=Maricaulis sp. TaxID=1486257 RepID=UPI00260CC6A8